MIDSKYQINISNQNQHHLRYFTYIEGSVDREEESVSASNIEHDVSLVCLTQMIEDPRPPVVSQVVQS